MKAALRLFRLLAIATPAALLTAGACADPLGAARSIRDELWAASGLPGSPPRLSLGADPRHLGHASNGTIALADHVARGNTDFLAWVIAHEIGHVALGHEASGIAWSKAEEEIAADLFAARLLARTRFNPVSIYQSLRGLGAGETAIYCPWNARAALFKRGLR